MKKMTCENISTIDITNIEELKTKLITTAWPDKSIIGYNIRQNNITLYLLDFDYCAPEDIIGITDIAVAYEELHSNSDKTMIKFKNPPLDEWLDTKQNWCCKMARDMNKRYGISYNDALSDIYFVIVRCYNRGNVYIGSLSYIQNAINNEVKCNHRTEKNKVTLTNENVTSLNLIVAQEVDGNPVELGDIIGAEDDYSELDDEFLIERLKKKLSTNFSSREIDQILRNENTCYLPLSIYRRLLRWREKNSMKDCVGDLL